jgi:hypothetical protein
MNELSPSEIYDLQQCEVIIARGLVKFIEVGTALLKIRDATLYRDAYGTFEDYCQKRWQVSRARAYQLIDAANVVRNVSTMVDKGNSDSTIIPSSERVARPDEQF